LGGFLKKKNGVMMERKTKERELDWIFTFGHGQQHFKCYCVIHGTFISAREKMFEHFGPKWCFQYTSKEAAGVDKWNLTELKL